MEERLQVLINERDKWQKKAMTFEKAMNQNNARAQKAEADLDYTRRKLAALQRKMQDIVRTAMESAIALTLKSVEYEGLKGREK